MMSGLFILLNVCHDGAEFSEVNLKSNADTFNCNRYLVTIPCVDMIALNLIRILCEFIKDLHHFMSTCLYV